MSCHHSQKLLSADVNLKNAPLGLPPFRVVSAKEIGAWKARERPSDDEKLRTTAVVTFV